MAKTSKYGFTYVKNLSPNVENPQRIEVILANSAGPLTIGDTVKWNGAGYLDGAAIDEACLGILEGFVTSKGENIFSSNEDHGGTEAGDDTFTAADDNITVHLVRGVVNIDPNSLYFAYNADALTQAECGLWFNSAVLNGTYPDSTTGTGAAWSVGTQVFQLIELVTTLNDGSASTTTGLFRLGRTQLLNDVTIAD
jgi:hypothetical protein